VKPADRVAAARLAAETLAHELGNLVLAREFRATVRGRFVGVAAAAMQGVVAALRAAEEVPDAE
jgi:hypothetical protein